MTSSKFSAFWFPPSLSTFSYWPIIHATSIPSSVFLGPPSQCSADVICICLLKKMTLSQWPIRVSILHCLCRRHSLHSTFRKSWHRKAWILRDLIKSGQTFISGGWEIYFSYNKASGWYQTFCCHKLYCGSILSPTFKTVWLGWAQFVTSNYGLSAPKRGTKNSIPRRNEQRTRLHPQAREF